MFAKRRFPTSQADFRAYLRGDPPPRLDSLHLELIDEVERRLAPERPRTGRGGAD